VNSATVVSVVDDDEAIRDSMKALLRSVGYRVEIFESAEQFLEGGTLSETGCLILDIRMPGMTGLELQRKMNTLQNQFPIIFVTAHDTTANRQLANDGGASGFFPKPVPAAQLLAAIEKALHQPTSADR
jgi:two-component system, LuxR family, response regulator FixJ